MLYRIYRNHIGDTMENHKITNIETLSVVAFIGLCVVMMLGIFFFFVGGLIYALIESPGQANTAMYAVATEGMSEFEGGPIWFIYAFMLTSVGMLIWMFRSDGGTRLREVFSSWKDATFFTGILVVGIPMCGWLFINMIVKYPSEHIWVLAIAIGVINLLNKNITPAFVRTVLEMVVRIPYWITNSIVMFLIVLPGGTLVTLGLYSYLGGMLDVGLFNSWSSVLLILSGIIMILGGSRLTGWMFNRYEYILYLIDEVFVPIHASADEWIKLWVFRPTYHGLAHVENYWELLRELFSRELHPVTIIYCEN